MKGLLGEDLSWPIDEKTITGTYHVIKKLEDYGILEAVYRCGYIDFHSYLLRQIASSEFAVASRESQVCSTGSLHR